MGKRVYQRLFLFFFFYAAVPVMAAPAYIVSESFIEQENLMPWLSFWQGEDVELEELVNYNAYFSYWQTIDDAKEISSWQGVSFKFALENSGEQDKRLVLALKEPLIDSFAVLQIDASGKVVRHDMAGNAHGFADRAIKHRHLLYPIDIAAGQKLQLFIYAKGRLDRLSSELSLWDRGAYFEQTDLELVSKSMYAALLVLFTLYAAFLIVVVRERSYLWFSVFTFSLFVRIMTQNNFFFEFLWPNHPKLQHAVAISALLMSSLSMALFVKAFLRLEEKKPKLSKVYNGFVLVHLAFFAMFALSQWQLQYLIFWLAIVWLFSGLILHNSYSAYLEGSKDALAFFIAYLLTNILSLLSIANHVLSLGISWVVDGEVGELILITTIAVALSLRIGRSQAHSQLQLAQSRAKNEFLAKMSHEIRTPINGVLGMTQLLQNTGLNRKQQHYADVISHCGKTLLNVINDILEYSKIEAGKLELEEQAFRLDELLQKHNEVFWSQILAKGLRYKCHLPFDSCLHLVGDASRIQQVLNNLFSNAIKFTEQGTIELSVLVKQISDEDAVIEFNIKDTGIGMSNEEQQQVFAPFVQADNTVSRRFGGSGLGLNITRELVKLMRGELHLSSHLGEGSEFKVCLPVRINQVEENKWISSLQRFKNKHIVQLSSQDAEEDELFQLLQHWGIKPYYFRDSAEGLSFVEHTEQSIDLVLMSKEQAVNMPALDKPVWTGQAGGVLIYSENFANSDTRVFGFNQAVFLKHPYSYQLLQSKLDFLLKTQSLEDTDSSNVGDSWSVNNTNLRVLVAEDDATNRLVIRAILKKLQLDHEIVADGQLALDSYRRSPSSFDLIIMDYEMPVLDGCQATQAIRQYEKEHQLPAICIVALTAHVLDEFKQRCLDSGMDAVLAKPIIINELVAILDQLATAKQ